MINVQVEKTIFFRIFRLSETIGIGLSIESPCSANKHYNNEENIFWSIPSEAQAFAKTDLDYFINVVVKVHDAERELVLARNCVPYQFGSHAKANTHTHTRTLHCIQIYRNVFNCTQRIDIGMLAIVLRIRIIIHWEQVEMATDQYSGRSYTRQFDWLPSIFSYLVFDTCNCYWRESNSTTL